MSVSPFQDAFGSFSESFFKYEEGKKFSDLKSDIVSFDSSKLELVNLEDTDQLLIELNVISRQMFMYGLVLESQNRILQTLEDEFDVWMATKSVEVAKDNKDLKSETAKENHIKTLWQEDYLLFRENIRNEKYKKGLIEKVVKGLDSFSYKLHSILSYKQKVTEKLLNS